MAAHLCLNGSIVLKRVTDAHLIFEPMSRDGAACEHTQAAQACANLKTIAVDE